MANNEFTIPIPARLKNVAKGGHVAGAKDIIDDALGKEQNVINQERIDDISSVKGGSTKSIADISEDIANEAERASGVEAGLRESIDELGQIGLDPDNAISTDGDDFDGDTIEKRSKIPTIGAIIDGNPGVYDVSKRNPTGGPNNDGTFTLEYILENADTLIPTSRRHGGMEICFVHSSDNKYVQFLYVGTSTAVADFTNTENWEKTNLEKEVSSLEQKVDGNVIKVSHTQASTGYFYFRLNGVSAGDVLTIKRTDTSGSMIAAFMTNSESTSESQAIGSLTDSLHDTPERTFTVGEYTNYLCIYAASGLSYNVELYNHNNLVEKVDDNTSSIIELNKKTTGVMLNAEYTASSNGYHYFPIDGLKTGDSATIRRTDNDGPQISCYLTNAESSSPSQAIGGLTNSEGSTPYRTFTVGEYTKFICVYAGFGAHFKFEVIYDNSMGIKVEEGSETIKAHTTSIDTLQVVKAQKEDRENIFVEEYIDGYYLSPADGKPVENASYRVFGFGKIEAEQQYTLFSKGGIFRIYFYDSSFKFISRVVPEGYVKLGIQFTSPANAAFFRCDSEISSAPVYPQIKKGIYKSQNYSAPDSPYTNVNNIGVKHRVLIVGMPRHHTYGNSIGKDLYKCGFLAMYCSWETFYYQRSNYKSKYDAVILCSGIIPYDVNISRYAVRTALSEYKNAGCKIIILQDAIYYPMCILSQKYNGSMDRDNVRSIADLLDTGVTSTIVSINEAVHPQTASGMSREIANTETYFSQLIVSFSGGTESVFPVVVTYQGTDYYPVVMRRGEYAIISDGQAYSSNAKLGANFQYVKWHNLLWELFDIKHDDRLSFDMQYGLTIAASGLDGDNTSDIEAIKALLEVMGDYPISWGFKSTAINENNVDVLRNLKFKYPKLELCTHTYTHYANTTRKQCTETLTIDEKGLVQLSNPVKATIQSVTNEDGTVTFERQGRSFYFGNPSVNQYCYDDDSYFGGADNEIAGSKLKFNLSLVAQKVVISYYYWDDFYENIKCIYDLLHIGLCTEKATLTTMGTNAISPEVYQQSVDNDMTLVEYHITPSNFRVNYLQGGLPFAFPMPTGLTALYDTTDFPSINMNGDKFEDMLVFLTTANCDLQTYEENNLPLVAFNSNKEKEMPFVFYIHDHAISETYPGSVWVDSRNIFSSAWKKNTFAATKANLQEFYRFMYAAINNTGEVYWTTRAKYSKFFEEVNRWLSYDIHRTEDRVYINIKNNGSYTFEGLTFKIPSTKSPKEVVRYGSEILPFKFNDSMVRVWVDVPANNSQTVILKY